MMEALVLNLLRRQEDETAPTGVDIQQLSEDNGDKQDAGKELLDLLQNPFKGSLQNASVVSALAVSLSVTAAVAIIFSFLRPYHQALYAPKLKHADEKHAPPPLGKTPWAWLVPIFKISEDTMAAQIGMDATIFLRFVRMLRNIFLCLTVLGLAILIPVNLNNLSDEGKGEDFLVKVTPLHVWNGAQWAQVVVAYLCNIIVAGFLWWNYRKVVQLRRWYFESDEYQGSLHSRTLMLFDIPKQGRHDEGIARIIDQVVPNSSFARTAVARNVKDLPELISAHDKAVRKLEKVLAKYLKNPDSLPPGRPTCRPSKKDPSYDTYPKNQRLDAIEYYTQRIRQLEIEIKETRTNVDKRSTMSYGFASYSEISEAHNIAYACRNKKPHGVTVKLAPRPNDIIWENMPVSKAARNRRKWVNSFWITLLTFLWIVPNAMIAIFLINLGNLGNFWPAFQRSLEASPKVWGAVQGILSPAIMSTVYVVLPMIFRRIQVKAGDKTKTGRERHVLAKLFSFFIFNNLIVFTLFSVIWTFTAGVIEDVKHDGDAWKAILKNNIAFTTFFSLCNNSPFWVTYLLQRQLGAAVDLAQLWPLIESFFARKFSSPTPRELIEMTAPPPFEYASYYNYFLFYAAVTLCYTGIQPLVLPATAVYFAIDYYLKKYLLLYRFVTKTESGGLFWRVLFNRMIFSCMLSSLVVLLTVWNRTGGLSTQFFCVIPLPFLMLGFKFYCSKVFDRKLQFYSTRNVAKNPEVGINKESRNDRLASRFGHPALYKTLITPMVNQKAQNLLPAVYKGRLTDGRDGGADDLMTISGYSDMYALNNMDGGKPGKKAGGGGIPGFEYVSDSQMDFEYYKNRAEFAEDHGGGEIYGRPGEIVRPNTPGSMGEGSEGSRPGTPLSGRSAPFGPGKGMGGGRHPSNTSYAPFRTQPSQEFGAPDTTYSRGASPLYSQDNSSASGLVRNAAAPPMSNSPAYFPDGRMTPGPRSHSPGPSMGALGGGPHGYSNLAQAENVDDPSGYDYFRGGARRERRAPGEGW